MMYDRLTRVLIVALALVLCGIGLAAKAQTPKPNIVIIVADDMGWNDVGYHGGIIATPNIDRLATEGVQLENWHVMPLCSPTRAGFMTGRWPIRFGMGGLVITPSFKWGMATTEHTIADLLGEAGYARRAAIGKWHLGHYKKALLPLNRGFTSYFGHYNGGFDYFTHERDGELDWHRDWESAHDEGYSTDLFGREAAKFIEESPTDEPFFLYVPFNAPHTPIQAKEEDIAKYAAIDSEDRRIYAAMVDSMDQAIGVILQALEDKNIVDNTFVLFFSDNGALSQYGDNSPWRGAKNSVYEGGVRTPALVRWPGGGIGGGGKIDGMMGLIDIYPTLKRLAGVTSEDPNPIDGIDVLDVMRGKEEAPVRDWFSYIAQGPPERTALCDDTWKMVVTGGSVLDVMLDGGDQTAPKVELFRLDRDPSESDNILEDNPEVAAAMLKRLQTFRRLKIDGIPDQREGQESFVVPKEWKIQD